MQITILKPGIFSTVQDLGRSSYLGQGVPISGAMDQLSSIMANIALGNDEAEATLEFTYANASFRAETDLLIAYCGHGAELEVHDKVLPSNRPIFIPRGSVVELVNNPSGARTYVAIAGGWDLPQIMGSKSTYVTAGFGGLQGRALQNGDILSSKSSSNSTTTMNIYNKITDTRVPHSPWSVALQTRIPDKVTQVRVVLGREFGWFDSNSVLSFLSQRYSLSRNCNRMGLHLTGDPIHKKHNEELLSTAVVPGTIQVSGDGNLILLMADCQTTGGYPRIAQVAAVDLSVCGQLKPDHQINFAAISQDEAEKLYLEQRKDLSRIKTSIAIKY
jgi:antagonist of KipI